MDPVFNPQEVGKGIADFGFLIIAAAAYLIYSATLFFFFIRWFVRIVNNIIEKQQKVLDEILNLQQKEVKLLTYITQQLKKVA